MKKNNLLLGSFLILSLSILPAFEKVQDPHVHRQKCIGGTGDELILYTIKLSDGNYLSCGYTYSDNGDFSGYPNRGGSDAFLIKSDLAGNIIWKNIYGGIHDEVFYNITETSTGDIIAVGTCGSDKIIIGPQGPNNQQATNLHGTPGTDDVWLVKTNSNGELIKQRCFGGSRSESTFDLGMSEGLLISKKGYILFTAETNSTDGDLSNKHNHGDYDGWVVKLDTASFEIVNSVTIGDEHYDALYNINEINGHFLVTGTKATKEYTGPYHDSIENYYDAFAANLDTSTLKNIWAAIRTYGGSGSDDCNASVVSSPDNNLILTGHTASSDGDCIKNKGFNTWSWKIDVSNGKIIWQNYTGEPGDTSAAFNIIATKDGGFVAVGGILHTLNPFVPDAYAAKIDANGNTQWTKRFGGSGFDQILSGVEENDGSLLLGGWTSSKDGDVIGYHDGPVVSQKYYHFPHGKGTSNRKGLANDAWLVDIQY